ncbi:hypothetical protein [Bacillus ndiopicus]|uniref:hypothetical protein n=1 Tax=Bacillus ndiopicus TaxID=1347368 RepID=UPI000B1EE9DB|nr:hypothetical protein [Bacillus ndiopicus]
MQKVRHFNRKTVQGLTKSDLLIKVNESELRGWQVKGEIKQLSNGHWACLMVQNT